MLAHASAGNRKPQLGVLRKRRRCGQDFEAHMGIGRAQRRCRATRRPDDKNALRRCRAVLIVQRREQRGDKVAAGDQRQCVPPQPAQSPGDAAVAKRKPRVPIKRQQTSGILVRRDNVMGIRRHHVAIRRTAIRRDSLDDCLNDLRLRQQAKRQAEEIDVRGRRGGCGAVPRRIGSGRKGRVGARRHHRLKAPLRLRERYRTAASSTA